MSLFIAFLAGMLTLLSPCTLPVIPFVFASVRGRKGQLLALLGGMVIMFTSVALLAAVASQWVTRVTAAGRWIALLFLTLTALTLLSSRIAQFITRPFVAMGNQLNSASSRNSGLLAALLAGVATGLLWSPCAGPVLGAILSLAVVAKNPVSIGLLLAAYGSGAAFMLGLIWLAGRSLVTRLRLGLAFTTRLRQGAGVLMLASVALIGSGSLSLLQSAPAFAQNLEQQMSQWMAKPKSAVRLEPVAMPQTSSALPSLDGGTAWLNGTPLTPEKLKGKVVLVDFWTYDCINCQHTLPHVRDWANQFQSQGLVVVGVHTPEYPWERDEKAVSRAIKQWQLPYPVVADNDYVIWNRFGNQYWPAHYLFDAHGQLRYTAFGEGNYAEQERVIEQLLKEAQG
ncbi:MULTISPECIES: cytochrome c biogenesis protein/redoxin [Pantoea]|uniref:cytochrome c biogenesis protein/redoxin n=2 Tax=Erwiniaceae TaxID=1903409 RepID=UPI0006608CED|nr:MULTISPECIES: cytochrome c biogenesis protein/redoxin [Pantoea]MBS6435742.1 redoxin domain-containing protein [Pantoea sp.]MDU2727368.1 cytochrome c biogenesis protein/redoxin [Pantoea sp.]